LRRPEEIENFSQPHFELMNEYRINNNVNLNSALFLVLGDGFFDYDGSWADTSYFRLTGEHGFNPTGNPGNAIIRAMVENRQFGWIPRISIRHTNGEFIAGTEFRIHRSLHWGSINFAENLPSGIPDEYRYYSYRGGKNIFNGFIHERYNLSRRIDLMGELQLSYHKYKLYNEKFLNNDFEIEGLFLNPKAAVNYRLSDQQNVFLSFARVTREPRLKNYYDAAESSYGEMPMFEQFPDGSFDFNTPLVKPETMNDFELGSYFSSRNINISLNLYYMLFNDEIVRNGKLDRFGQPITGNMDETIHTGIEASVQLKLGNYVELFTNATYSRNTIEKGFYFHDESSSIDLSGNRISGFPDFLSSAGVSFKFKGARLQLTGRYVGPFYTDNYDENLSSYLITYPGFVDYTDNKNDAYFTADLFGSYEVFLFNSYTPTRLYFHIYNLTDNLYSAYAIGKEFFPAAERNFILGVQLGL
jgi:iron complex outermembrane recepter protein